MMPASNASAGMSIGFPDVCLTPAAPAPIPVPYPNLAPNAMSIGFVPTLLVNMMPAIHMMVKTAMTNAMEGGAAHPMFKQMGGYTMGQPTILYNGIPSISLLCPTNGNMYNNPIGAKLVPDVVAVFLNSATGCTRNGETERANEGDAEALLAVFGRQPDHSAGWSLDVRTGIGGTVTYAVVRHVRRHTPAFEAGLQPGDRVLVINGRPVRGMRTNDLTRLHLEIGHELAVQVMRRGEVINLTATKQHTDWPLVCSEVGADGVGRIDIHAFAPRVPQLVDRELERLLAAGATSLHFDLRNNPGGDADAAIELASRLVPRGTLLAISVDADGTRREVTSRHDHSCTLPVTIDVNEQTASAAELFAGALQAVGRATITGCRTYGKGAASMVMQAGATAVREYRLPDGRAIERVGIAPTDQR